MDPLFDTLMARELPPQEAQHMWSRRSQSQGPPPPPNMGGGLPPQGVGLGPPSMATPPLDGPVGPPPPGGPPLPPNAPYINPITLHQMLAKYK